MADGTNEWCIFCGAKHDHFEYDRDRKALVPVCKEHYIANVGPWNPPDRIVYKAPQWAHSDPAW